MSEGLGPGARAGLYWRQSVDEKDGIERQQKRTRAIAKARGYVVAKTYEDNATSASKGRSTARWAQMLEDAEAKRIDVLIAVDVDRLLRSVTDLADLMRTGVKVLTVDGEIDLTRADGELRATMLTAVARFEVRRKSERQKRANEQRAARGQRVGGRRPFGYEADGVTVRPDEADAVLRGYEMLAYEEKGLGDVARHWNSLGLRTGQNKRLSKQQKAENAEREAQGKQPLHVPEPSLWTRSGVRQVMLNRRNIGQMVYLGEVQPVPAEWPALVDDELFEAVRAKLTETGRRTPGAVPVHLLTGIAECGVCHGTVHSGGARRKGSREELAALAEAEAHKPEAERLRTFTGYRTYRCKDSTGHFARRAEPVDEYVSELVVRRLARTDAVELLSPAKSVDARRLRKEERRLRERMDALAKAFAEDADDDDPVLAASQLRTATKQLKQKISAVQAQLADAGRIDLLGGIVGLGGADRAEREARVRTAWADLPMERKRLVVQDLLHVVLMPTGRGKRWFDPETVDATWIKE